MADISFFQYPELEDSSDGMEDDEQQLEGGEKKGAHQLALMTRLKQDAVSETTSDRQMVGKVLINIFQNGVKSKLPINVDEVFQPVEQLIYDYESTVRSSLVECLPHLALICQESLYLELHDFRNLTSRILNIVLLYLCDQDNQVRQDAQTALRMLLERQLLEPHQIDNDVCAVIVQLSQNENPEFQTQALTLMTKVNPYIGDELTERLFLDRFLELCSSDGFFVRRVCASIMGEFCTIMSEETIYNKLLLTYAKLSRDKVWGVRKTCVDVMMSVARCVPLPLRRHLLSKLLVEHLRDESRWVRRSAYEILGPFISTFAKQFHELICDQKGDLVLVHENERGWPRFNVVPVAKVSDILSENLSDKFSDDCWQVYQSSFGQDKLKTDPTYERRRLMKRRNKLKMKLVDLAALVIRDSEGLDANHSDEFENFNTFQFYHDPPGAYALDPELVNSIINDNEKKTNENEGTNFYGNQTDGDENPNDENSENSKKKRYIESSEQPGENDVDSSKNTAWRREFISSMSSREGDTYTEYREMETEESASEKFVPLKRPEGWLRKVTSTSALSNMNTSEDDEEHLEYELQQLLQEEDEDADEIVPRILVDHFVSMADLQSVSNEIGADLDYHCAFSFPAVVLTLGKDNWHKLKDAYQRLASAVPWKVRGTLASSIHEIAQIIEKDYAARDLVPIYNGFIKDLDEVRIGALKHFSTFLKVLSPQDRMQYLPKLNDFLVTDSKWNWRLREELAEQLSEIILLYQRIDVAQYIAPLLLTLMQDRVAAVRQEALDAVTKTIAYLASYSDDALAIAMIQEMRDLLMSHAAERWMIRQTYALICSKLVRNTVISREVFARELLPYLLELTHDKVPNVRLVVARTLAWDVTSIYQFPDPELMAKVKEKLAEMKTDNDRDVRFFAEVETPDACDKCE